MVLRICRVIVTVAQCRLNDVGRLWTWRVSMLLRFSSVQLEGMRDGTAGCRHFFLLKAFFLNPKCLRDAASFSMFTERSIKYIMTY